MKEKKGEVNESSEGRRRMEKEGNSLLITD